MGAVLFFVGALFVLVLGVFVTLMLVAVADPLYDFIRDFTAKGIDRLRARWLPEDETGD